MNRQPVLLALYNPGLARQEVMKIKVPALSLNILDANNKIIEGDVICANLTDANNCDLYFVGDLQSYATHYYKLVPAERGSAKIIVP